MAKLEQKPQKMTEKEVDFGEHDVWLKDVKEVWDTLPQLYQDFFLEWLRNGYHGGKAYATIYKKDYLNESKVCSALGSRLLTSESMKVLLKRFADTKEEDLINIRRVYDDVMNSETASDADKIRACQALAKLKGLEEKTVIELETKNSLTGKELDDKIADLLRKVSVSPLTRREELPEQN